MRGYVHRSIRIPVTLAAVLAASGGLGCGGNNADASAGPESNENREADGGHASAPGDVPGGGVRATEPPASADGGTTIDGGGAGAGDGSVGVRDGGVGAGDGGTNARDGGPPLARRGLFADLGFESGTMNGARGETHDARCSRASDVLSASRDRAREGVYSARHRLMYCDERSEVASARGERVTGEYWFGASYFVANETGTESWTILGQLAGYPIPASITLACGGIGHKLGMSRGRFNYTVQGSDGNGGGGSECKAYDFGPVVKGRWVDFVFHVKLSGRTDGLVEAWMDGRRVMEHRGRTWWDDGARPYFKFGPYKGDPWGRRASGDPEPLVVYTDAIRVGDATASYCDVAPNGTAIPAEAGCAARR
jgi:hypothetical protein